MAKVLPFKVEIKIDGKNVIVEAGRDARKFAEELGLAKTEADKLQSRMVSFGQIQLSFQNLQRGLQSITNVMNNLTEESNAFQAAMKASNTMAGKDAAGFKELKGQVADLAKNIPIARDSFFWIAEPHPKH